MKKDAHFYALLAAALSLGIEKGTAHKIAYASQFVDDAKVNKITLALNNSQDLLSIFENNEIINAATCHSYSDLSTYNYSSMTANTSAFHFVPGCDGKSFPKKMRCKKESKIIKTIIAEAVNNDDPIKLGIALHAYADTFSHQGFSGIASKVNDIEAVRENNKITVGKCELIKEKIKTLLIKALSLVSEDIQDRLIPAYGHGQAYTYPDIPYLKWQYEYDEADNFSNKYRLTKINNEDRFIEAFKNIKEILQKFLENNEQYRSHAAAETVDSQEFNSILTARKIEDSRIADWKTFMINNQLLSPADKDFIEYDDQLWLKKAFKDYFKHDFESRIVEDIHLADDFIQSSWYQYYQGIMWYKKLFFKTAAANGLRIPNSYFSAEFLANSSLK